MRRVTGAVLVALVACHEPTPTLPPSLPSAPETTRASTEGPPAARDAEPSSPASFAPERITSEGRAMGTHLTFAAFTTPQVDATKTRAAFGAAIKEIQRIEALMTTW